MHLRLQILEISHYPSFIHHYPPPSSSSIHHRSSLFLNFQTNFFRRKRWCYFINSNDDQPHRRLAFFQFPLSPLFSSNKRPSIVGSCDGLLCFADHSPSLTANIAIWNPSLQKHFLLPKPNQTLLSDTTTNNVVFFGFGFDSRTKDFKLIRILTLEHRNHQSPPPHVEIFSLASRSWRILTSSSPPPHSTWKPHQAFVNCVIHWVVTRRRSQVGGLENFVMLFDVSEETFGELALPWCVEESQWPFEVSILGGGGEDSLAVVHGLNIRHMDHRKFFSIWMMKEYGDTKSWIRLYHFDSESWTQICQFHSLTGFQWMPSVLALRGNGGEILMKSFNDGIVLLDPMNESVKKVQGSRWFHIFVGDYVESLFLLNENKTEIPELKSKNCSCRLFCSCVFGFCVVIILITLVIWGMIGNINNNESLDPLGGVGYGG